MLNLIMFEQLFQIAARSQQCLVSSHVVHAINFQNRSRLDIVQIGQDEQLVHGRLTGTSVVIFLSELICVAQNTI